MARDEIRKETLVQETAERLRERILASAPGDLIGSLRDLAQSLEVGIVTLQQAARIVEFEGLLKAKRGPGGGYYGTRPDEAALERSLSVYMRMNPTSYEEALEMTSLLFTELVTAAAQCRDQQQRATLQSLATQIDDCFTLDDFGTFELEFQELLFRMVRRPLFEMLTRVTLRYSHTRPGPPIHALTRDSENWKAGRRRIIAAILSNDARLARFEAERSNRAVVLNHLRQGNADRQI